jgi:hypothetical protein
MMNRPLLAALSIAAVASLAVESACAAPPQFNRPNRPTVSPYINLLNNVNQDPAITYYGQIRPQQEFRAADNANAAALRSLDRRLTADEKKMPSGKLSASGHATSFLNTRGYFGGRR